MTTTKTTHNTVVIKRPKSVVSQIALAQAIASAMANSATTFPTPTPPLAQLNTDIDNVVSAQTLASTKAKGAAAARNDKLAIVVADLEQERGYVQKIVNANPGQAETIAQAAGMALRKVPTRNIPDVSVKPDRVSGSVLLRAKGAKDSAHEWQYSSDGKTWTSLPSTMLAKTTIIGLMAGSTVYVQHRTVGRTGISNWSQPVSTIVT
jgi:hypothetical protein